jgi:hypothetical protein
MNNQSQPSFAQHPTADPTEGSATQTHTQKQLANKRLRARDMIQGEIVLRICLDSIQNSMEHFQILNEIIF